MAVQTHQYMLLPSGRVVEDPCQIVEQSAHLFNGASGSYSYKIRDDDDRMPLTTMPSTLSVGPSTSGVCYSQFLRRHDSEIDALIRAQRERIRAGLEETGKRRCREIVSAAGRRMARKEAELETARRINSELESKMEEVAAQARIWSNHAKNTEASALGLRAALDRLLRRVPPEDAGSCCHDENITRMNLCRACRERDVSVLLLPCRHLCLCRVCEPEVDACPICNARKSGGLQVLMG